ncbi:2-succinyl-5-enolpyruvyl-6-hydroxy-3-cyclohexene-1-carboxylic-acid synthase [Bacillus xiapuensis]|uniref:2-succinyl-5-enolpyruvyl-6-hydroxy-3- cyclohexene-1-carboxylic-acid synthase n=1 Tax=Bacillus xiapuensis TaxID=2014075 RepID=UPI000C243522|nr:2-succinyl-5-enolpyruvyl-6-hydroxy-3-cyclohexene-1-carboxylic-acid synthase [Bacillus xiapuensis]
MSNSQTNLTLYNAQFVDGLAKAGVESAVVSPGSRSTPMALLMAEHPDIKVYIQVDERSAAFFALGLAKATGKPTALLCTSGTAAANYFPAITEAKNARVPLVVLTSDRPHELRDVGAPQSIDQNQLYGTHVKWFAEMALPDAAQEMLRYVRSAAAKAVHISSQSPAGPVHLNFPYREPLIPEYDGIFSGEAFSDSAAIHLTQGKRIVNEESMEDLARFLGEKEKGLIVCGDLSAEGFPDAVLRLAETLGYPIMADPLSGLRSLPTCAHMIVDSYDAILRSDKIKKEAAFDVVLRFGAMPVSKALTQYLKTHHLKDHLVIDGGGGWRDPIGAVSHMINCEESEFCRMLTKHLGAKKEKSDWLIQWLNVNKAAKTKMKEVQNHEEMDEGRLFYEVLQQLPDSSSLFVGNSMPIRDLDSFLFAGERKVRLYANRGANGIDGLVSTALGAAAADQPLYLILGDLSFFHDVNGLLAAKLNGIKMTIIILNNNGGGIFSYLPQANQPKHFERLFGTPPDLDFSYAAQLYGAEYRKITDVESLAEAMTAAESAEGLFIIEAVTDREKNVIAHRELWKNVSWEIETITAGEEFWK